MTAEELAILKMMGLASESETAIPVPNAPRALGNPTTPFPSAVSEPPTVSMPAKPVGYEYYTRAEDYGKKADDLEAQAAKPMARPQGVKENIVNGARAFLEGLAQPRDPYAQQNRREDQFARDQAQLVERARNYRTQAYQQDQLAETAKMRDIQDRAETRAEATAKQPTYQVSGPGQVVREPKDGTDPQFFNDPNYKPKEAAGSADIQGYKQAVSQGYTKSFVDYMKEVHPHATGSDGMQIIQGNSEDGPIYYRIPKAGPAGPVQVGGETVHSKPAEAPTQLKNQVNAAKTTKDMVGIVRDVMAKNPGLTGPVVGRANELVLRAGGDIGGVMAAITGAQSMPEGQEKQMALLAGHLAYLFLNEARATMPGRPAKEYMDFVKQRSASLTQNPQIMEGYLQSAENNANLILANGAQNGFDPYGYGKGQVTPPQIPAPRASAPAAGARPANVPEGYRHVKIKGTNQTGWLPPTLIDPTKHEVIP